MIAKACPNIRRRTHGFAIGYGLCALVIWAMGLTFGITSWAQSSPENPNPPAAQPASPPADSDTPATESNTPPTDSTTPADSASSDKSASSNKNVGSELMLFEDIPVVVSAAKYEQQVTDAPAAVTIITHDDIRTYGYRTLGDALQSVPGFNIYTDRTYQYAGVRGFGRPGDYNSRVLILVDGHPINENVGDSGYIENEFPVDIDLIDRIEVIKGPGSSLYGGNAIFAVINVITKTGQHYGGDRKFGGGELSGEFGSYDTYKGRATYGAQFSPDIDMLFSGSSLDSNGNDLYDREYDSPDTHGGHENNDDENFYNLFGKIRWRELTFEAATVSREKGISGAPWGTIFDDHRTRTWDDTTFLGLTHQHAISDDISVNSRVGYHHYNNDSSWPLRWEEPGQDPAVIINKDLWRGRWWEGEVQFIAKSFDRHTLTWGAQGRYNVTQDQKNWNDITDGDVYLDDHRHSKSFGLYAQDEYKVCEKLTVNAGVRFDRYDTVGNTINPRLAAIYYPFRDTTIKLIYGTAFRSPNMYELYYSDGGAYKSNPNLDAETLNMYEAILEQRLNKALTGTADVYYYKLKDIIGLVGNESDDTNTFKNLDGVEGRGAELGLNGAAECGVKGRVSLAYADTRDDASEEWLTNSPHYLAKGNLKVPLIKEKLFAGAEVQYTSRVKTVFGDNVDDFIVTNLILTWVEPIKNLDVSVGLYNLFDVDYSYPATEEYRQHAIEQNGLNFRIKLTWRF